MAQISDNLTVFHRVAHRVACYGFQCLQEGRQGGAGAGERAQNSLSHGVIRNSEGSLTNGNSLQSRCGAFSPEELYARLL